MDTLTLSAYLDRISQTIKNTFRSPAWVSAEIVSVRRHSSGHSYFELAEYDPAGKEIAKTKATLWARQAPDVLARFTKATGGSLRDGIKILASVLPSFHAQFGFSLSIQDIDPAFTLGDLEAKMAMIRETLVKEKLYDLNKKYPVPFDFFSLVVVSPPDAAGLGDFRREADLLEAFGLVRFHYISAAFQGSGTAESLSTAIADAGLLALETNSQAIIVIRGGGAKTDLAYVNELAIARALCQSPVPVMVGIGHERDTTILDELALMRFDTPSKVVAHILGTVIHNAEEISKDSLAIKSSADKLLSNRLEALNGGIRSVVDLAFRSFDQSLLTLKSDLKHCFDFALVFLDRSRQSLDKDMEIVVGLHPRKILKQGFAIVRKTTSDHTCRVADLAPHDSISIEFSDGSVDATVTGLFPAPTTPKEVLNG